MAKKKKQQMLDAVPKFSLHFSADSKNDLHALLLLATHYHSHAELDACKAIIDASDAFDKYLQAKEELEK